MAGSISVTSREMLDFGKADRRRCEVVTIGWTADAADGSVPVLSVPLSGFVVKVVTNPGSTAPTANYDIAVQDPNDSALDAMATLLNNRHTSTTEQVYPLIAGAACPIFLCGTYGVAVTGNAVNSATGTIVFYLVDGM